MKCQCIHKKDAQETLSNSTPPMGKLFFIHFFIYLFFCCSSPRSATTPLEKVSSMQIFYFKHIVLLKIADSHAWIVSTKAHTVHVQRYSY